MTTTQELLGKVVTVEGTSFDGHQGLVIDVESDLEPKDGPIAVFFDREVPGYEFGDEMGARRWKGVPTKSNYRECPRVICFQLSDLKLEEEFSPETMTKRHFNNGWHHMMSWNFPLVPNTHLCQLDDCQSGALAVVKTYINDFGNVCIVYTCQACHSKFNGWCVEGLKLKDPLPGLNK